MKERFSWEDFPENPTEGQINRILARIKEKSFYAPLLVDTFLSEVDHESIVVGHKEPYGRPWYAIGWRIKGRNDGYMRITGMTFLSQVTLKISYMTPAEKDSEREALFDEDLWSGHRNRIYLESDDQSDGGIEKFGAKRQRLIQSDLKISFAAVRWPIAPTAISSSFDKWLITDFLPRFLKERVEPAANVPYREMSLMVDIKDDPLEI